MTCRKCGTELPTRTGSGRPPTYCSTGCRRATEYELRRLQKALEDLEDRLRWSRMNGRDAHSEDLEQECARLEARLRELLDDPEEVTT